MTEVQKVTIRSNIDKKILNLYSEGKCLSDIQATLTKVGQDFKKIIANYNPGSPRYSMISYYSVISYYSEFTDKRVKDLEFIKQSYKQLNKQK